jgi:amidase
MKSGERHHSPLTPLMKIRNNLSPESVLAALALLTFLSGCSLLPRFGAHLPNRAFIAYWPPAEGNQQLRLAVKDNIDMEGVVTTAGSRCLANTHAPAEKDAPCLAIARQRNVQFVGKANLSEFALSALRL